jgi:hypothetical protein
MFKFKNQIYSKNHFSFLEKILISKRLDILEIIKKNIDISKLNSALDIGTTSEEDLESSNIIINNLKSVPTLNCISDQEVENQQYKNKMTKSIADTFTLEEIELMKSDLVISNAVIEHVGSLENQIKMVENMIRLSNKYILIQTPNRWFPIEVHSKLPLIHWLPKKNFRFILRNIGYEDLSKEENLNPLTLSEIHKIMKKCQSTFEFSYRVLNIKTFGFISNFIIICKVS